MRCLFPLLLLGLLGSPVRAQALSPLVAVFDIEDRGSGLKSATLRNINDYIADRLAASDSLRVISRERLLAQLAKNRRKTHKPCFTLACQRGVGKELGAHRALATRVMKIGKSCVMTCTLQNLRKPRAKAVATTRGACGADGVMASAEAVLAKLTRVRAPSPGPGATTSGENNPRFASLAVTALSGRRFLNASVYLDGKRVARTPALLSNLKPGTHLLKIKSKGYKPITRALSLAPGQRTRLVVNMTR